MDIHYYHKNRQQSYNPCALRNGDCSHLCLLSPSNGSHEGLVARSLLPESQVTRSCHCPTGFSLDVNRKTCNTKMTKYDPSFLVVTYILYRNCFLNHITFSFLVIARRSDVRVISLDVAYAADVKLSLQAKLENVIDVAVDPVDGKSTTKVVKFYDIVFINSNIVLV